MGKVKDYRAGFKDWLSRPAGPIEILCPRCCQQNADPIFLGREGEGHICPGCWADDRNSEGPEYF